MSDETFESDPDGDDGFDTPAPYEEGDDSVLAERYGHGNHAP